MKLKTYFVKLGFGRGTRKLCFCGWCLGKILINFETDFKTIFVVAAAQLINCVLKYFKLQCLLGMYSGSFNNALLFSFLRFAILLRRLVLLFFFFCQNFVIQNLLKRIPHKSIVFFHGFANLPRNTPRVLSESHMITLQVSV